MSKAKSKSPLGLYDLKNNLLKTFINQVELAAPPCSSQLLVLPRCGRTKSC